MNDSNQTLRRDAERALACLDLTSLNLDDTPERIDALCDRAISPAPGIEIHPAAVCIYPQFVAQARRRVHGHGIAVAAVANFPLGTSLLDEVIIEVEQALADGADEIDVVFPFRAYMAGDHLSAGELVRRVSETCRAGQRPTKLKVILETGVLHEADTIKAAAAVAVANGADFLKTSTGKLEPAATPEAAGALLDVIAAAQREGQHIGLKVAGGVKTVAEAAIYLAMADAVLQPSGAEPTNFRFGASGLLNDIVSVLGSSHVCADVGRVLMSADDGVFLPQEIIRAKRDGTRLTDAEIKRFVQGITDGSVGDAQAAALAMAVFFQGMDIGERVALTTSMSQSGSTMKWDRAHLHGPVVDKHSTGGVGDKVSLMLAPLVASCGAHVPMISGRGLGHTGGTFDKLESIPGYQTQPDNDLFHKVVAEVGCAIIGQTSDLAPADGRLYAIRDVTATVESIPLITASILSKKLAAGLDALVMNVTFGNGAFMTDLGRAEELARSIVDVAVGAGLRTNAVLTDMNQVLGHTAGNALEVRETIDWLTGASDDPRLTEVVLALGAEMLVLGGLDADLGSATRRLAAARADGSAAERFQQMVTALGGPNDLVENPTAHLRSAAVTLRVEPDRDGYVQAIDTRSVGLAVVALGGGRMRVGDSIDHTVGLSDVVGLGEHVDHDRPIAVVHARSDSDATIAAKAVRVAVVIGDTKPETNPVVASRIVG